MQEKEGICFIKNKLFYQGFLVIDVFQALTM